MADLDEWDKPAHLRSKIEVLYIKIREILFPTRSLSFFCNILPFLFPIFNFFNTPRTTRLNLIDHFLKIRKWATNQNPIRQDGRPFHWLADMVCYLGNRCLISALPFQGTEKKSNRVIKYKTV